MLSEVRESLQKMQDRLRQIFEPRNLTTDGRLPVAAGRQFTPPKCFGKKTLKCLEDGWKSFFSR